MNLSEQLRKNVDSKQIPKQLKYMSKLLKQLERNSKYGEASYEIIPYYMPSWFTSKFKYELICFLEDNGFNVDVVQRRHELGTLYSVIIIEW